MVALLPDLQGMADGAFSGRKAACEEVERLLENSDDLKHLQGLLVDFSSKHQASAVTAWTLD